MTIGITFDNIIDAQDYQKTMFMQGYSSELKHLSIGKYKVVITGDRKRLSFGDTGNVKEVIEIQNPLSDKTDWHFKGANAPEFKGLTKGFLEHVRKEMPSRNMRRNMDLYGLPYDIDKEIRMVVIDLSKHGFDTVGSCAGHVNLPGNKGFISFSHDITEPQKATIRKIAEKHGMKEIEFDNCTLLFRSFVKTSGETFRTKEEADLRAKELRNIGHRVKVEKRGHYFMVYKDGEVKTK